MALPDRPAGLPTSAPSLPTTPPVAPVPPAVPAVPAPSLPTAPMPVGGAPTAAPGAMGYQAVGSLSADQLLYGRPDQFAHLDDKVVAVKTWLQDHMTKSGRAEAIAEARLNPAKRAEMSTELDRVLIQYTAKAANMPRGEDRAIIIASVINEVLGLGPIEPLWADPRITEVMVNGPDNVFAEIGGKIVKVTGARFRDREHLLDVCQGILMPLNRRVDQRSPLADGRLSDGSRVNIAHHAVAPAGPLLTIRRFPETVWTVRDLVENGSLTEDMAVELAWLIYHKCSAIIVGGTGSGKALDIDTPIPTPNGFKRMGDLVVGDTVFDEQGQECTVTGAYDTQYDRPCYEVVFSDGSSIVADAEHLWVTETRSARRARSRVKTLDRKRAATLTVAEIARVSDVASSIPGPISVSEFAAAMGWNATRRTALYAVAKACTPVEGPSPRRFDTKELAAAVLDRWSRPWHDQRHLSATAAVVNTAQIKATLRTGQGHANHSIPVVTHAVAYPERELPVDPYLLGVWLGDGCASKAEIATEDSEIVEAFQAVGYRVTRYSDNRCNHGIAGGFKVALREAGVLNNKHIPSAYLHASEDQRRALLAGLLDSDGSVTQSGTVEFYSTDPSLAAQVRSLVASLGYQASMRCKPATFKGVRHKDCYTVAFSARGTLFRLPRKQARLDAVRTKNRQSDRASQRYIVDVREVPSRPVRCIRVSSQSRLFLAGEQYVPTHNTSLLNALSSCIPRNERVVTIEDALELRLHPEAHVAAMEARPASASGEGEVKIRDLVKNALRMRPDRIVVGEVRDAAALDMLNAMNTGHEGSMTTVHANDADAAINRLSTLVAMGGDLASEGVAWLIGDAVDLMIVQRRYEDGSRRVAGIYEVPSMRTSTDGQLAPIPLWEWVQTDTTETGKFIGEYVQRNEISDELKTLRRLTNFEPFTMDDVYRMSELPENLRKK